MLFNGRSSIFTFSGTQVRIAEIERLQSVFKMSMGLMLRSMAKRKTRFFGRIMQKDAMEKRLPRRRVEGKWPRGRPAVAW